MIRKLLSRSVTAALALLLIGRGYDVGLREISGEQVILYQRLIHHAHLGVVYRCTQKSYCRSNPSMVAAYHIGARELFEDNSRSKA